ncbi:unnamed protein product [Prunus armeniaca]|uniref:F-box domain-containing protein n=1 Tax=Prunus armeniaca TaxID=36596 RepID=A0A6J5VY18_PRUAR|nr:unnamed protein product [Prunus armeniaca]CAB4321068.1 unnamed protein product [Prunus armeniaca]
MSFWNVVKDEIVLPLSFDLCKKVGLPAPASFMQLPSVLPAEDIAKVGCVCKESRELVDDEELWKQLVLDEFVHDLFFSLNFMQIYQF